MSIRTQRLKQHKSWTKQINQSKDQNALSIIKRANALVKASKSAESLKEIEKLFAEVDDDLLDLIYKSLEKTYSQTCKMVSDIYDITSKSINIKDLTYDGDGKTLDERVTNYIYELLEYIRSCYKEGKPVDWEKIKRNLHNRLLLILDTETQTVKIKVTKRKVEAHCEFGEVLPGQCCPGSGGIFPIDELDEPPYHPGCMCEIIYYEELTDDSEEIEDLELEVEKIYE